MRRALLLSLILWTVPAPGHAAGVYDPEVEYETLTTPNFLIMYPDGYEHIALRAGHLAEDMLPKLTRRYGWEPAGRTSIVINDQTDFANGSATILPSKVITIYVTAPTEVSGLEDYDDWLANVLTHELTHIIHLDMAYGLVGVGRWILGKWASPNVFTPRWVTEGLAVYEETVSSASGRGRSAYVDMVLRMAALEDRFPGVDQGYSGYANWPFTNVAYFVGGRFQLWLAERFGEAKLVEYHQTYAAVPIPHIPWISAQLTFGESLESLWSQFEEETKADALLTLEQVRSSTLGLTQAKRLTRYGGDLLGPHHTPDGQAIIYSVFSPVDGDRMRRLELATGKDEVLVDDCFSKDLSFAPDGKAFYFQQTEINQRFYTHNSVLRYDVVKQSFSRIQVLTDEAFEFLAPSGSLRARDPDVSPDGKRLVFVQTPDAANRLVLAWLEGDGVTIHPRVIVPAEPDVQLSTPRFSPDGARIAVSRFARGRRDLVIYDLTGRVLTEVTRDRAQDIDPEWSPDGRWLLYASDRTGIYNIYAFSLERGETRQLTNVIGGAYQPNLSPDGRSLVFRGYSADGFDVYQLPFTPEGGAHVVRELDRALPLCTTASCAPDLALRRWPVLSDHLPALPPPAPPSGTALPKALPPDWSFGQYSALATMLPFHDNWNLFPTFTVNESEIVGSLSHFGGDALGKHSYALEVNYGSATRFVGGGVGYLNDQLEPTFGLFASADARTFPRRLVVEQSTLFPCPFGEEPLDQEGRRYCYGSDNGDYHERRLAAQVSLGLPVLQRHFISLSYAFEDRRALGELPSGTVSRVLPRSGHFARVSLGYTYSNVRAFAHSVSLERGWSFGVAAQALSKGLGSDYEELLLTAEGRAYLSLPWLTNHVLAGRLALGYSVGPDLAELFRMGGSTGRSALTTTTENFYGLRGLLSGALIGTSIANGSLEYRAPILRIDRGLWTIPVTFQVIHLGLFADFGRVFEEVDRESLRATPDELAVGVGAELRADVTLFYSLPLRLIVGYARAAKLPKSASADLAADGVYFQIGSTF